MGYYRVNGTNVINAGYPIYTSAAVNARYKNALNVLTTLDVASYYSYSTAALTGYKWSGSTLQYIVMSSMKMFIKELYRSIVYTTRTVTVGSTKKPVVVYAHYQAPGGAGGTDTGGTGCGGGSGQNNVTKIILQPGASLTATLNSTSLTLALTSGYAYINGAYRAAPYSFSITASAGANGSANTAGSGFRSGGAEEANGATITPDSYTVDGMTSPKYNIYGGRDGAEFYEDLYDITVPSIGYGGGGGGAGMGYYLGTDLTSNLRRGGDGAYYYAGEYVTYRLDASDGLYGSGGGGNEYPALASSGGARVASLYYNPALL